MICNGPGGPFCFSKHLRLFCLSCLLLRLLLSVLVLALSSSFFVPFLSSLVSVLVLSCPGAEKRDPPYPPLVGGPSLPTPSRIGRMAIRQEGGGGDSFSALGFGDCQTLLLQGSCFSSFWSCVIRLFKP